MTYETYLYLFYIAAGLSSVMLILSIVLFIRLKIPKVIGELSGSTARKAIQDIKVQSRDSDEKAYGLRTNTKPSVKSSVVRGAQTADMSMESADETSLLQMEASETSLLQAEGVLNGNSLAGAPLRNETVLLNEAVVQNVPMTAQEGMPQENGLYIDNEITFIYTQECIE